MDDQKKKQVIVAAALGAVLVAVLVYQLVLAGGPSPTGGADAPPSQPQQRERPARTQAAAQPDAAAVEDIDILALTRTVEVKPINYAEVSIDRNPMTPLVGIMGPDYVDESGLEDALESQKERTLMRRVVTGIIWDPRRPLAIIDNNVVHEGYVFADGVVVHEIEPTRVLLKDNDMISPVEMKEF